MLPRFTLSCDYKLRLYFLSCPLTQHRGNAVFYYTHHLGTDRLIDFMLFGRFVRVSSKTATTASLSSPSQLGVPIINLLVALVRLQFALVSVPRSEC